MVFSLRKRSSYIEDQVSHEHEDGAEAGCIDSNVHDRLSFLAQASQLLAASLNEKATLREITCLAVPRFADYCIIFLLGEATAIEVTAICHRDPGVNRLLRKFERFPLYPGHGHPMSEALLKKKAVMIRDVSPNFHRTAGVNADHEQALQLLSPISYLAVPLMVPAGGAMRIVGGLAMVMTSDSGRRFTEVDQQMAQDLGERCAFAIENARLYREARQAVRERDAFIAVSAHEFRTPVTSIRAVIQTLIRQFSTGAGVDLERLKRMMRFLDEQSERLTRVINQLFDMTQIELGELKPILKDTDIVEMVRSSVEKIRSSNPKFSYVINAPRPVTACVDSRLFTQVISNLIENAVKYASEGGRVEIEITLVGTDDFRVSVRDFGKGMPQSQLRKIFDPFDRVTRSEYSTGLGLGLFICKRILEFHGGSIRVDSPPDGGTRFTITAPLRDTHSETRAAA